MCDVNRVPAWKRGGGAERLALICFLNETSICVVLLMLLMYLGEAFLFVFLKMLAVLFKR